VTIRAADGLDVALDDDHWKTHIVKRHPELTQYRELVIETLQHPEAVYRSKRDPTTRVYARSYSGLMIAETLVETVNLRVVVREKESFVVTAYFVGAMWRGLGERIWPS
jgi:hypothetical protein